MGFGFRKSFSSGPFRITASRSGVSSSFGVRGARISSGPRGTFVTVSSHGVSYRHRVDGTGPSSPGAKEAPKASSLDSVFQVPVAELAASNQTELVTTLNRNVSATNPAIFVLIASCFVLLLVRDHPMTAFIGFVLCLLCGAALHRWFKVAHTHEIHYSLDKQAEERYAKTQAALGSLASCSRVWTLETSSSTKDFKRNAGASTLITRNPASVGSLRTEGFKPSLPTQSIRADNTVFHFLPDQILVLAGKQYVSIAYEQLKVEAVTTRFIESDPVPSDSTQVGSTWRFVNKDGGPDRRFNDNRRIPVLQYGEVFLRTTSGLHVVLQASNVEKAEFFAAGFRSSPRPAEQPAAHQHSRSEQRIPMGADATLLECYLRLGISRPTTRDQASAAYRHQASLYHPDKYEHLAPEMKVLASAKMNEINAAYSRIKADIGYG